MEQNQNQNNNNNQNSTPATVSPASNQTQEGGEKISTTVGVLVLIIIVGTIAFFTYEFIKVKDKPVNGPVVINPIKKNISQNPIGVGETVGAGTTESSIGVGTTEIETNETVTTGAGTTSKGINFDAEINKLDAQNNTIDADDYSEGIVSDAEMGL